MNLQIQKVEAGGQETAMTLRDERDNLLDELGGYGSVSIKEDATGFTYVDLKAHRLSMTISAITSGCRKTKKPDFTHRTGRSFLMWTSNSMSAYLKRTK